MDDWLPYKHKQHGLIHPNVQAKTPHDLSTPDIMI